MADYVLTVNGDDDATVLFEVGTAASHAHPYLKTPAAGKSAEVDLVRGTASIGQQDLEVIDPQTGATQSDRWLTALLGDADGYSALNGRRAVLAQVSPAAVVVDGVIAGVTLLDNFAGFKLSVRDIRERGVKVKVFTQASTTTVLPRGVLHGYGQLPATLWGPTRWVALPTVPLAGTYQGNASSGRIALDGAPSKPGDVIDASLVVTPAMQAAMRMTKVAGEYVFDRVSVWWRAAGASTWDAAKELRNVRSPHTPGIVTPSGYTQHAPLVPVEKSKVRGADGSTTDVLGAKAIAVDNSAGGTLPTNGQAVEVVILYRGEPSEDYPFHFEGGWGTFVRNLLRGDYGAEDEAGTQIAPRFRYDEASLLAIDTPIRIRLTEPKDDLRSVLEELCLMIGAAPAVDDAGRLAPIFSAVPDASVSLPQIDDTNAKAIAGWDHPTSGGVTQVTVTYPRDRAISAESDPNGDRSAGDGLTSTDVTVIQRAPAAVTAVMGVRDLKIDAWAFRALGGREGDPISGDVTDEAGAQLAVARAHEVIDRFAFGGISSTCQILASDFPGLQIGDWVLDARSWRPNYATGKRGGNSLSQVVSLKQPNPSWYEVRLIDCAPADNPASAPTLGTVTAGTDGVVSVPVTAIPAGEEARVDYALSATTPTANSSLWTFLARTASTGTLKSPAFPVAAKIWIRARGEAVGRRPSAWSTPVSVTIPGTPRVLSASLTLSDAGVPTVGWEVNPATLGMRLYYEAHDPTVSPILATYLDADASDGAATIPASAGEGQAVTVAFEPWTGWSGTAVSGTAGDRLEKVAVRPAGSDTVPEEEYAVALREIGRTAATVTFGGAWGSRVDEVRVFEALVAQPITLDEWPEITGDPTQGPFVGESEIDFLVPPQGYARLVLIVPFDAHGFPGAVERITILPTGTEPDLVTGITALIGDADGSAVIRIDVADRTTSIRYAYAVGAAPSWPSDATVEAGTVVALTGSTTISLLAGTVPDGQTIRVRAAAYVNVDGTGKDGAVDHGPIRGAEDVRRVTTTAVQAIADAAAAGVADGKVTTFYQAGTPTAEAVGDLWIDTDDANKLYRWSGSAWVLVRDAGITQAIADAADAQSTADSKIVSFFQTTTPTADGVGDFWVDTDDDNHQYRWNGSAWVSIRDGKIAIAQSAADSAQADASNAITAAATAQATADGKVTTFYQTSAPTAEGVGDLWVDTDDGNKLYRWSGSAWVVVQDAKIAQAISAAATAQSTADGKIVSFYQTSAPTAGAVGDLWVDTDDNNKLYRWSGSAWVSVRDAGIAQAIADAADAQATADGKIQTFYQTGAPTAGSVGDLWVDTDDSNKLYRWSGAAWVAVDDARIAQAITDAAGAQATADGKVTTFYQASAPSAEGVGDLWVDTDDNNNLYRWSGTSWVSIRDGSIPSIAGLSATIRSATAPTTRAGGAALVQGDQWIETDNGNKPYIWDGGAWTEAYTSIDGGSIKTGAIRSTIYTAGSAGWSISFAGDAEFNSATIRGTLDGVDGTFAGTVTADSVVATGSFTSTSAEFSGDVNLIAGGAIRLYAGGIFDRPDIRWVSSDGATVYSRFEYINGAVGGWNFFRGTDNLFLIGQPLTTNYTTIAVQMDVGSGMAFRYVQVGAADSAGSGWRTLRVAN